MPLQILSELPPEPEEMKVLIKRRIEENISNSDVDVSAGGPGHFEITVESTVNSPQVLAHQVLVWLERAEVIPVR